MQWIFYFIVIFQFKVSIWFSLVSSIFLLKLLHHSICCKYVLPFFLKYIPYTEYFKSQHLSCWSQLVFFMLNKFRLCPGYSKYCLVTLDLVKILKRMVLYGLSRLLTKLDSDSNQPPLYCGFNVSLTPKVCVVWDQSSMYASWWPARPDQCSAQKLRPQSFDKVFRMQSMLV